MTLMARWTYYSPFSPLEAHISKSYCSQLTVICFPFLRWARGMRVWDNNGCRGGPRSAMTDCRVLGLVTRLGPVVWPHYHQCYFCSCLPSVSSVFATSADWYLGALISSVLTMIPIGHHWWLILQSYSSPLTPLIPLIWCCLSLLIQQTMMTPNFFSTFFFQISLTSGGYSNQTAQNCDAWWFQCNKL